MSNFLITICIPTYNRAGFLKECLESIVGQFEDGEVVEKVEVAILDNISEDDTEKLVKDFAGRCGNIKYHKDTERRGIAVGAIKAGSLGTGKYIWFFSDDDKQTGNSIKSVIRSIEQYNPDVAFCNTSTFVGDVVTVQNNFRIDQDVFFKGKRVFFKFVSQHIYCSDFLFTYLSNIVIKRNVFNDGLFGIEKYNSPLDLFLPLVPVYLVVRDMSFLLVAEPVVLYRAGNASWGPSSRLAHEVFTNKLIDNHLKNIFTINRQYLTRTLIANFFIRRVKRKVVFWLVTNRDKKIVDRFYLFLKFCKDILQRNKTT